MGKMMQSANHRGDPETQEAPRAPGPLAEERSEAETRRPFGPGSQWKRLRRKSRKEQRLNRRHRRQERRIARRRRRELKTLERQLVGRSQRRWAVSSSRANADMDLSQLESMIAEAAASAVEEERERLREELQKAVDRRLRQVSQKFARWQRDSEERVRTQARRSIEEVAIEAAEEARADLADRIEAEVERRVEAEVRRLYPRLERTPSRSARGRR